MNPAGYRARAGLGGQATAAQATPGLASLADANIS